MSGTSILKARTQTATPSQRDFAEITNGMDNGSGTLGVSASLVVPSGVVVTPADLGTADGVSVPVGYSYSHDSEDGSLLSDDVALTAVGNAYWIVTRRLP